MLEILIKTHVAIKKAFSDTCIESLHVHHMNDLKAVDDKISGIQKKHTQYRIFKFGGAFVMGIIGVFLAQITIIPIIHLFLGDNTNHLKT